MKSYVEVILPLPLEKTFIYSVPENLRSDLQPGKRVLVPFRSRILTGFIFRIKDEAPEKEIQIKPILSVLDEEPLLSSSFFQFLWALSQITIGPLGEFLKAALPPDFFVEEKGKVRLINRPEREEIKKQFRKRYRQVEEILRLLAPNRALSWRYLQRKASLKGFASLLRRLEELGWVKTERKIQLRKRRISSFPPEVAQLNLAFLPTREFELPLAEVEKSLEKKEFKSFLLFGPRARREEFFLSFLRKWGRSLPNILILVPEMAEISSFLEKITGLIGSRRVAVLHGELSPRQREASWLRIWRGEAVVVIGPRSAVFAPLPEIRLIYLTEEADEAYLHPSPFYDAREVAKLRARQEKAVILFGSSAPSISLLARARKEGSLLDLGQIQEKIRIISHRSSRTRILSPELQKLISERFNSGKKVVLLVNRRGYASFLSCLRCGYIALCPECRRPLTLYARKEKLICHHCGFSQARWQRCPECQSSVIGTKGHGLEAVEEEVKHLWPEARIKAIEAETLRGKEKLMKFSKEVEKDKLDIIIGTQFLRPHLNWQKISLTAVLSPELMLAYPDFRSGEKVFSLIRRLQEEMVLDGHGELIVQTAAPDNYVVRALAAGDYYEFASAELRFRRLLGLPPFKCLARLILSGSHLRSLGRQAREIKARLTAFSGIEEILGPSILPSAKGKYQVQMWVKAGEKQKILSALSEIFKESRLFPTVEIID